MNPQQQPEIFTPLKHLSTHLELLGNIYFSQEEYSQARRMLERACPLKELVPKNILLHQRYESIVLYDPYSSV
jgi:hypothetical protein